MTIPRGSRGVRVMVVEDNAINQLLVRRQLERLGYDAVVFDTGTDAVEHFADTGASVILMDWQLPGIDGIETTRRIRAAEEEADLPRTPIVAMTASALPGDRDRCLAAGMDDFIAKPVSMVLLGDVIRRWAPDDPGHRPAGAAVAPRPALDAISWGRTGGWTASGAATPGADGAPDPDAPPGPPGEVRAAAGAASSGAIDLPALDRLVEDLTDRQLVASVVRTYLRELPPRLDAIERAVVARDGAGIEGAAHVLRSTSAAVGALRLAERCQDLERDPGAADAAAIESLRAEATAVHAELSTHLAALVATV